MFILGLIMTFKNDTKRKIFVLTNGCPENRLDSYRVEHFFIENEWPMASSIKDADIILFNACGQSCEKSLPMVKELQNNKKKNAELVVFGCLPKTMKQELKKIFDGPTFGSDDFAKLDELFPSEKSAKTIEANALVPHESLPFFKRFTLQMNKTKRNPVEVMRLVQRKIFLHKYRQISHKIHISGEDIFNIKISSGCSSQCTYCSIRFSRGLLKSTPVNDIIIETRRGINSGYKKIALIGTEIANYGSDIGINLPYLLDKLLKLDNDYKIMLRNLNPHYFLKYLPELIEIFRSGRISHLETAVQSGNNRILKLMKRGYTIEEYKQAIHRFKQEVPGLEIRTQVMVNFPSETEEEAQDTMNVLKELQFDLVELYDFRAEPYTLASKMEPIPHKIARKRYHDMYMEILNLL